MVARRLYHRPCMGNFTFSEIMVILIVILIIFGPDRLPELARKAGQLARKAREATTAIRTELTNEYGDIVQPLQDVAGELKSARQDLTDTAASIVREPDPRPLSPGAAVPQQEAPPPDASEGGEAEESTE